MTYFVIFVTFVVYFLIWWFVVGDRLGDLVIDLAMLRGCRRSQLRHRAPASLRLCGPYVRSPECGRISGTGAYGIGMSAASSRSQHVPVYPLAARCAARVSSAASRSYLMDR